ncbi:uncharacterized protein PpBr36_06171 [Pyricularia pennisetigena]|uniref:uncharacterized protein n=1 Tax=Pyricularia pennisetigena TaxID=1578925 RepID=UPI00114FCEBA|nr:uncharacterized protein PpBr36_06171 [Pyricularia pennisetigena]TLS22706.1 hypothetical protein PpBr36_06171 [Pyricularia pennisetigena]
MHLVLSAARNASFAAAADAKRAIAVIVEKKKSCRIYLGTYFYAPAVASLQRQAIVDWIN